MSKNRSVLMNELAIRWARQRAYQCRECGKPLRPLDMTHHQIDIWEKTGLCPECQAWRGER
jgi:hypothetical protein